MQGTANPSDNTLVEELTRREREILALLAEGLTGPEIAERLTLALSTVKWHVERLYGKLGASSKREALNRARAVGLLSPAGAGALPAAPALKHNLPVQITRFFGREDEIAHLRQRLAEDHLVTLTGPGGVGKTRLALRAAEVLLADYPEGVWFVELAALTDPTLVAQQIAATLQLRDDPSRSTLEILTHYLRERRLLIVLDNCEHLLESCARVAAALLRACPGLRLLACSREPLGAAGEAIVVVPSLPIPTTEHPATPDDLQAFSSVRLFTDRARLVRPDYQVTAHNAASIAGICQRVDGIPLALEMAAARVTTLSAEQIAGRLDDAFRLLTAGSRTALPRQQTLRATIDWSYQLLSPEERRLLQRLSVFAGGCTLEAAEAICSGDGVPASQVLDLLASLVSKSMVVAERPDGEEARYRLLEMVRQYSREKLHEDVEPAKWHRQHLDYFTQLAETNVPKLAGDEHAEWRPRLAKELGNFRQALEWSFDAAGHLNDCIRLLWAQSFEMGFRHHEALDWHMRCLARCQSGSEVPVAIHAKLMMCAGALTALNDPLAAVKLAEQGVALSRAMGPAGKQDLMWYLHGLAGLMIADLGELDGAVPLIDEAEALCRSLAVESETLKAQQEAMLSLAFIKATLANWQGRHQAAKTQAGELIQHFEASGETMCAAKGHNLRGIACLGLRDYQAAREHFRVSLDLNRQFQGWEIAYNLRWLGAVDLAEGDLERALEYCCESLVEAELIPDRNIIASNLGLMAAIYAKLGQPVRAARLAGTSAAMYARQKRKPWEDSALDTILPGWRERPDEAAVRQAFEDGEAMSSEQASAYALGDHEPQ